MFLRNTIFFVSLFLNFMFFVCFLHLGKLQKWYMYHVDLGFICLSESSMPFHSKGCLKYLSFLLQLWWNPCWLPEFGTCLDTWRGHAHSYVRHVQGSIAPVPPHWLNNANCKEQFKQCTVQMYCKYSTAGTCLNMCFSITCSHIHVEASSSQMS